mgnify:CR=1 FL=1
MFWEQRESDPRSVQQAATPLAASRTLMSVCCPGCMPWGHWAVQSAVARGHHSAHTGYHVQYNNMLLLQAVVTYVVPAASPMLGSCQHGGAAAATVSERTWRLEHSGLRLSWDSGLRLTHCGVAETSTHQSLGAHTCRSSRHASRMKPGGWNIGGWDAAQPIITASARSVLTEAGTNRFHLGYTPSTYTPPAGREQTHLL